MKYQKVIYDGNYSQLHTAPKYVRDERLNTYQNLLYNRALYGLAAYDPKEVKGMHWEKKKRIDSVHKKTKSIINRWKQEMIIDNTNKFLNLLFPKSKVVKQLMEPVFNQPNDNYNANIPLKEFKVKKLDIIDKLIIEGVLPKNYYELKPSESCK